MHEGKTVLLDQETKERYREYRFRRLFSATHEQYLEETRLNANWLLSIDEAVNLES